MVLTVFSALTFDTCGSSSCYRCNDKFCWDGSRLSVLVAAVGSVRAESFPAQGGGEGCGAPASTDPSGYDLDNARDRQLNGHN
jgi:hypothetical protein